MTAALLLGLLPAGAAFADTATVTKLYDFSAISGDNSLSGLFQGRDGAFYGTFFVRDFPNQHAEFYRLSVDGTRTVLYRSADSTSSSLPGVRFQGSDGNFYGVTGGNGVDDFGSIFQLTPQGVFTTLYRFSGGLDGIVPYALFQGGDGNFYGTTSHGGIDGSSGTIFRLSPAGVLTTLHDFSPAGDGAEPGKLIQASDGNFYGVTGAAAGTVFKITRSGELTTLHVFTESEGRAPNDIVEGRDGNFYGSLYFNNPSGAGAIYQMTPQGAVTVLHQFLGGNRLDGANPVTAPVQLADGSLYGTTANGGEPDYGSGMIYKLTPSGASFTILYVFGGSDNGYGPLNLVPIDEGHFFGTTNSTIYRLSVTPAHPAFFVGEVPLSNGVYYLQFASGSPFGYYAYLNDPRFIYHFDLGYEYWYDAGNAQNGVFLYDFASKSFFYTAPSFPFPYLYDFSLNTVLYYFPDPNNPGRYNTNGVRYFYNFATGQIIVK